MNRIRFIAVNLLAVVVSSIAAATDAVSTAIIHPTVECEYIHPYTEETSLDNHSACQAHCLMLGREYDEGKCISGLCHCRRELAVGKSSTSSGMEGKTLLPTVECSDFVMDGGIDGDGNMREAACKAHCRSLNFGYLNGKCFDGVCNCEFRV